MATQHILPKANYKSLTGIVVNAGERLRTIRVRVPNQTWNERLHKFYNDPQHVLVHDPRRSCDVGDVVNIRSNWRVSKYVRHVVTGIVSPFGRTITERPPIMTETERVEELAARRRVKDERQAARGRLVSANRLKQIEKIAAAEAIDEARALKHLSRKGNDLRGFELQEILVRENDLDLNKRRVRETIITTATDGDRDWALSETNLNVLTLWLTLRHAAAKHLYIGKDLPIRAGKSPTSAVIREAELMSAFLARRADTYRAYFDRITTSTDETITSTTTPATTIHDQHHGKTALLRSLQGVQRRLTHAWRQRVFDTNEPDARAARQEKRRAGKVGSDPALVASAEQAWLAVVRGINADARAELLAERRWWSERRRGGEGVVTDVGESQGENVEEVVQAMEEATLDQTSSSTV